MFKIENGRLSFWQWDINQRLIVEDASITEVHFCNRTGDCSLVCEVYEESGKRLVNVPNILLQDNWVIRVYAYCVNHTKIEEKFTVYSRSKPADYIYTETEIKNYEDLAERISQIEENGISDEAINGAIERYLDENGINAEVDLSDYATKEYVDNAVSNVDIPDVDLSNYYTKQEVDSKIPDDVDLSNYALKSEIPSIEGLATEQYVDDAIANIDISGGGSVGGGGARLVSSITVADEVSAISLPLPADEDWWIGDHKYTLMVTGTIGATAPNLITLSPNSTADFGSTGVVRMLSVKANANQDFMIVAEIYKMGRRSYSKAHLAQPYSNNEYPRAMSWSLGNDPGNLKSLNFVFQNEGATMLNTTIELWEVF